MAIEADISKIQNRLENNEQLSAFLSKECQLPL